jgi:hypothetical protein
LSTSGLHDLWTPVGESQNLSLRLDTDDSMEDEQKEVSNGETQPWTPEEKAASKGDDAVGKEKEKEPEPDEDLDMFAADEEGEEREIAKPDEGEKEVTGTGESNVSLG